MIKLAGDSILSGELPIGCRLCRSGLKSVVFITGICPRNCFYCPLTLPRKGDVIAVNERIIIRSRSGLLKIDEIPREKILEEIRMSGSKGASITGGDPLAVIDRTAYAIRLLKEEFGKDFHIHLYTSAPVASEDVVRKLYEAGLDEIRIHPVDDKGFELARIARKYDRRVGFEIPVIPLEYYEKRARKVIEKAIELGLDFVNLNELEATEANQPEFLARGLRVRRDSLAAIEGSYELGLKLVEAYSGKISLHLCTAKAKDAVQFRNRLIRRAHVLAKPYHIVTPDGTRIYAEIRGDIDEVAKLLELSEVPKELREIKGDEIHTSVDVAKFLAENYSDVLEGVEIYIVERYPTADKALMYEERLLRLRVALK